MSLSIGGNRKSGFEGAAEQNAYTASTHNSCPESKERCLKDVCKIVPSRAQHNLGSANKVQIRSVKP